MAQIAAIKPVLMTSAAAAVPLGEELVMRKVKAIDLKGRPP
jgi:hypothetical protein